MALRKGNGFGVEGTEGVRGHPVDGVHRARRG